MRRKTDRRRETETESAARQTELCVTPRAQPVTQRSNRKRNTCYSRLNPYEDKTARYTVEAWARASEIRHETRAWGR